MTLIAASAVAGLAAAGLAAAGLSCRSRRAIVPASIDYAALARTRSLLHARAERKQ